MVLLFILSALSYQKLVTSNFSVSHSVFKRLIFQGHQMVSLCGNGLSTWAYILKNVISLILKDFLNLKETQLMCYIKMVCRIRSCVRKFRKIVSNINLFLSLLAQVKILRYLYMMIDPNELPLFLAPLAVGQRAYVMVRCPSVRALTFSLNIFFAETTYRILMKFHRNVPTMVLFRIS